MIWPKGDIKEAPNIYPHGGNVLRAPASFRPAPWYGGAPDESLLIDHGAVSITKSVGLGILGRRGRSRNGRIDRRARSSSGHDVTLLIPINTSWTRRAARLELESGAQTVQWRQFLGYDFIVVGDDIAPVSNRAAFSVVDNLVMQYMQAYVIPNVSLAISNGKGELVYAKGFTYWDFYDRVGPTEADFGGSSTELIRALDNVTTPLTLFRTGSVTKPVVATCVFKAIEEGRLSLTDQVLVRWRHLFVNSRTTNQQKYFLNQLSSVQIQHLLSHSSGWANGRGTTGLCARGNNPKRFPRRLMTSGHLINVQLPLDQRHYPVYMMDPTVNASVGELLASITRGPTFFTGTTQCYDNFNYQLLGLILEDVYGAGLETIWRDTVFGPLNMHTSSQTGNTLRERRRQAEAIYFGTRYYGARYTRVTDLDLDEGWKRTGPNQISNSPDEVAQCYGGDRDYLLTLGSDGLRSNAVDLVKFAASLRINSNAVNGVGPSSAYPSAVLSTGSLAQMWQGPTTWGGNPQQWPFRFGVRQRRQGGLAFGAWHGGDTPGAHAMIETQNDASGTLGSSIEPRMSGASFAVLCNRYRGYNPPNRPLVNVPRLGSLLHNALMLPANRRWNDVLDVLFRGGDDLFTKYG